VSLAGLWRATLILAALSGRPAFAEGQRVEADLDGDGMVEIYRLDFDGAKASDEMMFVDLVVETGRAARRVEDIVWSGGFEGSKPELSLGPSGEVLLDAMNGAYGRDRWHQTITIAFFDGDWRVAGLSYSRYDTLDLDDHIHCDLDARTGVGLVTKPTGERRIDVPVAPALWDWPEAELQRHLPDECYG
jgi:hypothetical protein